MPAGCDVILVCDQTCLSDAETSALTRFAESGGRLVVTGASGACDERHHQRLANPLAALDGRPHVVRRAETDAVTVRSGGWTLKVAAPKDGGRRLMADLASVWTPTIRIHAPATVFAEIKRSGSSISVHLLNYAPEPVPAGSRIELCTGADGAVQCTFAAPMEGRAAAAVAPVANGPGRWTITVPGFTDYSVVDITR